jgi:hypothetical protein
MPKVLLFILICFQLFGIDHPVSTKNPEAQRSFNEGLTNIFAFNHDLAFHEFEKASQLDPNLAMAYWGMALALGQNINTDVTPENEIKAFGYSRKALSLLEHASPVEQAYIKALAVRYTDDPKEDLIPLRLKYSDAMKGVAETYPEDLDAVTLYAESILDLSPWKYWTWDGKPLGRTMEVIGLLESVLRRDPNHIGANHYNIHAWEASTTPERALLSAYRLTRLLPESGHLLHMPCHIFILTGNYKEAAETSKKAIAADREYIKEYGMGGHYPLHYLKHNLMILIRINMLSDNYEKAIAAANELNEFLAPYFGRMPELERQKINLLEIYLYFYRWNEILAFPRPDTENAYVLSFWHFSRAISYSELGDKAGFEREKALFYEAREHIDPKEEIANNRPSALMVDLADILLKVAENPPNKIALLEAAVDKQDRLEYDEPPGWYIPLRIPLGNALLKEKRYAEAEAVFRKGLAEYQRNPRLLYGLYESLRAQNKDWDAGWVYREWLNAAYNSSCLPKSDG